MTAGTPFLDFYQSDLQSVYALCVVPVLFLAWLLAFPSARSDGAQARRRNPKPRFLYAYCVVFALETIVDPIATGPFLRWLDVGDSALGTAIPLAFVLLGDFRVYLLIFRLAGIERQLAQMVLEAVAWTFLVPIVSYVLNAALHHAQPDLPEATIWLVYELAFFCVAMWLRLRVIPRRMSPANAELRRRLQAVAGYAAVYYALWATADILTMVFGLDLGWALRVLPNQLYYSLFLPFVYFQLSSRR